MHVRIMGNQTGRLYYDPESIVAPISYDPFSRTAVDCEGFRLQIRTRLNDTIHFDCSYNELVILRNILNDVIK